MLGFFQDFITHSSTFILLKPTQRCYLRIYALRELLMKYSRFEDLPVWNDAIAFGVKIFSLTSRSDFKPYRSIRDQIERAAMSVSNNIAEGFERGTTQETADFSLYRQRFLWRIAFDSLSLRTSVGFFESGLLRSEI